MASATSSFMSRLSQTSFGAVAALGEPPFLNPLEESWRKNMGASDKIGCRKFKNFEGTRMTPLV